MASEARSQQDDRPTLRRPFGRVDAGAALALCWCAIALTWIEYHWLAQKVVGRIVRDEPARAFDPGVVLEAQLTWAIATIVLLLIVPLGVQLLVHRESPVAIGWNVRGLGRHLLVYVALFLFMLPFVFLAADRPEFQATYPFVPSARKNLEHFLLWESVYLLQFLAVEGFFRGYLLFRLERAMGSLALFVSAVPYAMIHFHKPAAEAFGAIVAGIALGALALRYRSFLGGVLLHAGVALAMDLIAVRRAGLF